MNRTNIGWTNWSVNPFKMELPDGSRVNVCIHKSDGCRNCYAETLVKRWWRESWGKFPGYTAALLKLGKPVLVEDELRKVLNVDKRIAQGVYPADENRVFWNDMTDEFLDYWPDEFIDKCFAVRALTPNLIHQVLTKRIDRANPYLADRLFHGWQIRDAIYAVTGIRPSDQWAPPRWASDCVQSSTPKPLSPIPNVHFGVSVEDQKTADERLPLLMETPAAKRFVSYEPALAPVDFTNYLYTRHEMGGARHMYNKLDWGIAGGESGAGYRGIPDDDRRIERAVLQFRIAKVPIFVKQDSGPKPGKQGRIPDEYFVQEFSA